MDPSERNVQILRTWEKPANGITERDGTIEEMNILFARLPSELSSHLQRIFPPDVLINLNEIYMQRGQVPECIFSSVEDGRSMRKRILDRVCTKEDIEMFAKFFGAGSTDGGLVLQKRKGIPNTLHRVSLITHPARNPQPVLGVAVRVGRAMQGLLRTMVGGAPFLVDLALRCRSLLLLGKPGVGKTTALREIAEVLARDPRLNVVVVDKTCEIAGDGEEPHAAIGGARWMPVGRPNLQHEIMREAVENQTPDVIIVDEISTAQEVEAARTIAQRGVQLVATAHGQTLPGLINCRERGILLGGCTTVTLSGKEAERRSDKKKQVQKRAREPIFHTVLELHSRDKWIQHKDVKEAVDSYFEGEPCDAEQLEPGRAIAVTGFPQEGGFDYRLGTTRSNHFRRYSEGEEIHGLNHGVLQSAEPQNVHSAMMPDLHARDSKTVRMITSKNRGQRHKKKTARNI